MEKKFVWVTRFSFFLAFLFFGSYLAAAPRGLEAARQIAHLFYQAQGSELKTEVEFRLAYPYQEGNTIYGVQNTFFAPCYLFTWGENSGFVVVSGDDRAPNILAYSFKGFFSDSQMPPSMKAWLQWYEDQMVLLQAKEEGPISRPARKNLLEKKPVEIVSPLLEEERGTISYNQGAPYNAYCPNPYNKENATWAGCVAVAFAQVVRYYKFPEKGKGKVNYISPNLALPLSRDLSASVYDWQSMLPSYRPGVSYTEREKEAVANLVRDIGYAVRMDYGYSASSVNSLRSLGYMITHMSYASSAQMVYRDYCSDQAWHSLLKTELDQARPIYYSGRDKNNTSGHAFVCDGYDDAGYYHFNWGWDGWGDGWYSVDYLAPTQIGAGAGNGNYSYGQSASRGFIPSQGGESPSYFLCFVNQKADCGLFMKEGVYPKGTEEIDLPVRADYAYNYSSFPFKGCLALIVCQNGKVVDTIGSISQVTLGIYGEHKRQSGLWRISDLAEGNYQVCLGFMPEGKTEWQRVEATADFKSYYEIKVTKSFYRVTSPGTGVVDTIVPVEELMFSEYICASPYNKAIEIYNGSNEPIDLSAYSLKRQENGEGEYVDEWLLSGTLLASETYVLVHDSASKALLDLAQQRIPIQEALIGFDGNDALALFKGEKLLDELGRKDDPKPWGAEIGLRRKCEVSEPLEPFLLSQWTLLDKTEWSGLGKHCESKTQEVCSLFDLKKNPANGKTIYVLSIPVEVTAVDTVRKEIFVQDSTSSISLYDPFGFVSGLCQKGDRLEDIQGNLKEENGFFRLNLRAEAWREEGIESMKAHHITLSDLQDDALMQEVLQSRLVCVRGVHWLDEGTFVLGQAYRLSDKQNSESLMQAYFHQADYLGKEMPKRGDTVDLTGIMVYSGNRYYIAPRTYSDLAIRVATGQESMNALEFPSCIYPNPVSDYLYVKGSVPLAQNTLIGTSSFSRARYRVEVWDMWGHRYLETEWANPEGVICVSAWPTGIYALRIQDLSRSKCSVYKFVKR